MTKLKSFINIKIGLIGLIIASILSLLGDWIFPSIFFTYGLLGVYILLIISVPIILIWIQNDKIKNKYLTFLISIWIGVFVSFFAPHMIFVKIGNLYWTNAAIKTEKYINDYNKSIGIIPETTDLLFDSSLVNENFIYDRYIRLIHINPSDSNKIDMFPFDRYGYELVAGFWIADLKTWNPKTKEWILIF